jgi:hypothetical protein
MLIAIYIFLGLLLFDYFIASCLYFRKERAFDPYEDPLNYLR